MNNQIIEVLNSSCLKAISYNPETKTLFLKFNDSPFYSYSNIEPMVFAKFVNHPKKGKYYHEIKASLPEPKRLDN